MLEQLVILGLVISSTLLAAIGCGRLTDVKHRSKIITVSLVVFAFSTFWLTEKGAGQPELGSDWASWVKTHQFVASNPLGDNSPSQARPLPELNIGERPATPNTPVLTTLVVK